MRLEMRSPCVRSTAEEGKSYVESLEDAQAVVDAYHDGSAEVLRVDPKNQTVVVRVPGVRGTWVSTNHPAGLPDIANPSDVFSIRGKNPKVFPINPTGGRH